jgi:hypothetical protein
MFELTPAQRLAIHVFSQDLNDTKAIEALNAAMPHRFDAGDTSPFIYDADHLLQIGGGCDWLDLVFEDGQLKDEHGAVDLASAEPAIEAMAVQWLEDVECDLETLVGDEIDGVEYGATPLEAASIICGIVDAMGFKLSQAPVLEDIAGIISGPGTEEERTTKVMAHIISLSADA